MRHRNFWGGGGEGHEGVTEIFGGESLRLSIQMDDCNATMQVT
jgi:hypothetical protein